MLFSSSTCTVHPHSRFSVQTPNTPPTTIIASPLPCSVSFLDLFDKQPQLTTPSPTLIANVFRTFSEPTVTSATTFHKFPISSASITNKSAVCALLHSLSDFPPTRQVHGGRNGQPHYQDSFTSSSVTHFLASSGAPSRFRICETVQHVVPFPQLDWRRRCATASTPRDINVRHRPVHDAQSLERGSRVKIQCVVMHRRGMIL